ncbi:MAG TPA: winged helix-turn-helix domain-containing protein [Solirubrobacterales bacterium]|nr:winged helix-turn-helix domain-containing protein [Solirubrobacterales bacterium]
MPAKQKAPQLLDDRLVAAFSHETRAHALGVFAVRPASTKEIASELNKSVSAVWYHVDRLRELGCIEPVRSVKRRGAMEHFYRATVPHFFDDETWASLPSRNRQEIVIGILRLIGGDLNEAMQAGVLDTIDNHLSRSLLHLDRQGWNEAKEVLDDALERLFEVRERSSTRMAESGEDSIRVSASIMQFELPSRSGSD